MAGILDEFLLIFRPTVKGSGFQQLNKQAKEAHSSLFGMKNLLKGFIGYDLYSGIKQFGTSLIQTSKDLGAMNARFYAITKSEKLAGKELEWVFNLAQKTAMPLKETADSYSIFYAAVQKSIGQGGARQVFQDWTEVSRVLHLSPYQFERVTYALREMASKGAIYSQDLRMQIGTHVPNAMGLAEKAVNQLGITGTDWFEKFQDKAKGNQQFINQFIVLFSKFAKEQFASAEALSNAMKKPDSVIQALINSWQLLQMGIVKGGFEKDLVATLGSINALLAKIVFHSDKLYGIAKNLIKFILIWKSIGIAGKGAFKIAGMVKNVTLLATELGGIVPALKHIGKLFAKTGLLRLVGSLGGAGALTALFTTPPGWIILGLAGITVAALWFKKTFPNAWKSMTKTFSEIAKTLMSILEKIAIWLGIKDDPKNKGKENIKTTFKNAHHEIAKTGGTFGNLMFGDAKDVMKYRNALCEAQRSAGYGYSSPMGSLWDFVKKKSNVQQTYNMGLQMIIKEPGMTAEEILNYIKKNQPKASDIIKDLGQQIIKQMKPQ